MNQIISELMQRKSVRVFTDRPISAEDRKSILYAAMAAPTPGNQQMYTIIDVQCPEKKEALAELCDHQPFIASGKLVLVFAADYRKWYDAFRSAGCSPREPEEGDFILAVQDSCIAAQNAVTAADSLGIGSCYIGDVMENCETMKELLHLPKYVFPSTVLVFGYPTEQQKNRKKPDRFDLSDIVCVDEYHVKNNDELRNMFRERIGDKSYENYMNAFCSRKYNSAFSEEMSRSVSEYLKEWQL